MDKRDSGGSFLQRRRKRTAQSLGIDSGNDYLDIIEALNDPIERITKEVEREVRSTEDAKLLMTIPGVSASCGS